MTKYILANNGNTVSLSVSGGVLPKACVDSAISRADPSKNIQVLFYKKDGTERLLLGKLDPNGRKNREAVTLETADGWKAFRLDSVIRLDYIELDS